jgi:UDP-N-acetylmuramate--alanine ligase
LQLKYNDRSIKVFDDYAHHPSEVRSSISALREISSGRIITVFQPHLYSRTRDFYSQFARELANSDIVILTEIYPARENPIEGVTSRLIYNVLAGKNKNVFLIESREDILLKLISEVKRGDVIVFQGAGDINQLCDEFIEKLGGLN